VKAAITHINLVRALRLYSLWQETSLHCETVDVG